MFHRDATAAQQHGVIGFYSYEAIGRDLLDEVPPERA